LNVDSLDISDIKYNLLENALNIVNIKQKKHQELLLRKNNLLSESEKNNSTINFLNIDKRNKTDKTQEINNILLKLDQNNKKTLQEKKIILLKEQN
jgi:hypothetical protein